jgi:serine protease
MSTCKPIGVIALVFSGLVVLLAGCSDSTSDCSPACQPGFTCVNGQCQSPAGEQSVAGTLRPFASGVASAPTGPSATRRGALLRARPTVARWFATESASTPSSEPPTDDRVRLVAALARELGSGRGGQALTLAAEESQTSPRHGGMEPRALDPILPTPEQAWRERPRENAGWGYPEQLADNPFVRGQVVVQFTESLGLDGNTATGRQFVEDWLEALPQSRLGLADYQFAVGTWGGPDVLAVRILDAARPVRALDHDETRRVIALVEGHADLSAAGPNFYRWAFSRPNDEHYGLQWHFTQIAMETTWQLTTGDAEVVVAVIDDGVNVHPDFAGRLLPGYDMIADPANGCGAGRNSDAGQRPNCSVGGQSVWHGVHVAGTVGATTNNGVGLAGVDWTARILPIRVLGLYGGETIDIIAGIHWAVGIDVPGVPSNPNPADVINMSLGGGPLGQADQAAIDAAVARGAIVVVAAGNENQHPEGELFASADNVIVVGALDYDGRRSPYSNYGPYIDIMAPGGDVEVDRNADGYPDGVLSLYYDPSGTEPMYDFHNGTSMAAPHVAGIAALMRAVNRNLSHADAERLLRETADPAGRCPEGCGAGLVNPAAAIRAAAELGGDPVQTPTGPARLELSADRVNVGGSESGQVRVFNAGGSTLQWQVASDGALAGNIQISGPSSGSLQPAATVTVPFAVSRGGLAEGNHQALLRFSGNGGEATVAIIFRVGAAPAVDVGEIAVGTFNVDDQGEIVVGGAVLVGAAERYTYVTDTAPGSWFVIALSNPDDFGPGDLWGMYPNFDSPAPITVLTGGRVSGIDFALVPYTDLEDLREPPCLALRQCWEYCDGDEPCMDDCPVGGACESCWNDEVLACANALGCDELLCVCLLCEDALDSCFGPHACF